MASPHVEQDQDSDSSSCDVDTFSAVCDPSLGDVYLNTKHLNVDDFVAPVERVTGDVDLDCTLRDVKRACRNLAGSSIKTTEVPPSMSRFARARPTGPSFLLSLANTVLEKRVLMKTETDDQPEPPPSNSRVPADEESESFQLLADVSVSSHSGGDVRPPVSPSWLRKLQRRHGFSFFHPEEEDCLEERCKKVAICGEFIANRGLAIPYAEHRNVNPRKLIRIPATPAESNQRTGNPKKKKKSNSKSVESCAKTGDASSDQRFTDTNKTRKDESKNPTGAQEIALLQAKTKQENGTSSELNSSKKKKTRKRGPKKGQKRVKLSEGANES